MSGIEETWKIAEMKESAVLSSFAAPDHAGGFVSNLQRGRDLVITG